VTDHAPARERVWLGRLGRLLDLGTSPEVRQDDDARHRQFEELILGGPRRYTRAQLLAESGMDPDLMIQLWRSLGFAEVPDDVLSKIAPWATVEEWPEGKVIVKEGGFSNHFYAIEAGTAKVERDGEHLADLGPGDVFGEQGLLEKQERSATVTSSSEIRLIKIEHWELSRMRQSMPEVVEELRAKVEARRG